MPDTFAVSGSVTLAPTPSTLAISGFVTLKNLTSETVPLLFVAVSAPIKINGVSIGEAIAELGPQHMDVEPGKSVTLELGATYANQPDVIYAAPAAVGLNVKAEISAPDQTVTETYVLNGSVKGGGGTVKFE